jgi:transcription elongation factor GreA
MTVKARSACKDGAASAEDGRSAGVIARIADARSHGDFRRNADLRRREGAAGLHRRAHREVEAQARHAQVIDPAAIDADGRVVFGATVELRDSDTDDERDVPDRRRRRGRHQHGKISVSSRSTRALIGKERRRHRRSAGAGPGAREFEVLAVRYG